MQRGAAGSRIAGDQGLLAGRKSGKAKVACHDEEVGRSKIMMKCGHSGKSGGVWEWNLMESFLGGQRGRFRNKI